MKKMYSLLAFAVLFNTPVFSQTLFSFGNTAVGKDEFLRAYNKNKTAVTDKQKSIREYLDLYTKFKLKVKAAQELKLDTLQQLQADIQSFRSQVEDGYLNDEKRLNLLLDEALLRSQKDIHLIHFIVPTSTKADNIDTANATKAINEVIQQLNNGRTDFANIATETSAKFIETKQSDMGFVTALSLPYKIENLVYELKPGETTPVYKTKSGLHVFKNIGERKSAGRWRIAQILLTTPPNPTDADLKRIGKKADSVYNLLINGGNLIELAKEFSEDKNSYQNGGELPEFGTGKFEPAFETKIFELKKDGEISRPILSSYGYHIIKRIEQTPTPADKSDESYMFALKQQILQDSRINTAKEAFLKEVLLKTGFKKETGVKETELFRLADSVAAKNAIVKSPVNNKLLISFAKSNLKVIDWLKFVKDYKLNADVYKGEDNPALFNKFISTSAFDYYRKHLDEYNVDFKYQMNEFKEGNMLFEVMERNVWNKAANDTAGLKEYHSAHREKYVWAESADIILYNCIDVTTANIAIKAVNNNTNWRKIAEESEEKIMADSGRYEISQLQLPAGTVVKKDLVTTPLLNTADNTSNFIHFLSVYPANQQRSFEEARGLVINDYQTALEEKWINELKAKYPIKVNDAVLESLVK